MLHARRKNEITNCIGAALLCFVSVFAQAGDYRSVAIKTRTGYIWVSNEPDNYYTLEIPADSVTLISEKPKAFTVDGLFLQIVTTRKESFLGERAKQAMDDRAILEAHRDWELKSSEDSYHAKLTAESSWQKFANGKEGLLWKFNAPEGTAGLKKEIYLTQVKGDRVLLLGGVVNEKNREDAVTRLLLATGATLKILDKPTELNELKETIRKANPN